MMQTLSQTETTGNISNNDKLNLNSPFIYHFPATYGNQFKPYYQISVPMRVLGNMLRLDDAGSTLDRSQRIVNEKRASEFASYIIKGVTSAQPFVIPCLTGFIETDGGPSPEFINCGDKETFKLVGMLLVGMDSKIKLLDGQHRGRGIIIARERLKRHFGIKCDIDSLHVPVVIFSDLTLSERQIMFSDINTNATKPAASISIAYNRRDPLSNFAVELAAELPFRGLVDYERNTIAKNSSYLFPLKTISDCIKILIANNEPTSDELEDKKDFVRDVFQRFSREMGWSALKFGGGCPADFRESSILTHTVMLKGICEAAKRIVEHFGSLDNAPLHKLSTLDYSRYSPDFTQRCIDNKTGNMMMNRTGIILTANLLQLTVGASLDSKQAETEILQIGEFKQPTPFIAQKPEPEAEPEPVQLFHDIDVLDSHVLNSAENNIRFWFKETNSILSTEQIDEVVEKYRKIITEHAEQYGGLIARQEVDFFANFAADKIKFHGDNWNRTFLNIRSLRAAVRNEYDKWRKELKPDPLPIPDERLTIQASEIDFRINRDEIINIFALQDSEKIQARVDEGIEKLITTIKKIFKDKEEISVIKVDQLIQKALLINGQRTSADVVSTLLHKTNLYRYLKQQ